MDYKIWITNFYFRAKSKLLQFILMYLKKPGESGDGMAPKEVPRFAKTKIKK